MQKESYDTATTNLLFVDCETQGHPLTKRRIHLHNLKLCVVMAFLVQKPASKNKLTPIHIIGEINFSEMHVHQIVGENINKEGSKVF